MTAEAIKLAMPIEYGLEDMQGCIISSDPTTVYVFRHMCSGCRRSLDGSESYCPDCGEQLDWSAEAAR